VSSGPLRAHSLPELRQHRPGSVGASHIARTQVGQIDVGLGHQRPKTNSLADFFGVLLVDVPASTSVFDAPHWRRAQRFALPADRCSRPEKRARARSRAQQHKNDAARLLLDTCPSAAPVMGDALRPRVQPAQALLLADQVDLIAATGDRGSLEIRMLA
jgi:hypothetical protein